MAMPDLSEHDGPVTGMLVSLAEGLDALVLPQ